MNNFLVEKSQPIIQAWVTMLTDSTSADSSSQLFNFINSTENADTLFYETAPEFDESVKTLLDGTGTKNTVGQKKEPQCLKSSASNAQRSLASYYGDIGKFKPFTRSEEETVFLAYAQVKKQIKQLEKTRPASPELRRSHCEIVTQRNQIVEHNLRFVVKLARDFWMDGNFENFENLISAGNVGLIRAVDKFDVKRGTRFLSYAAHWIALEIRCELANSNLIKVPVWYQKTLKKLVDAFKELSKTQDIILPKNLARQANVPVQVIAKLSNNSAKITFEHIRPTKVDVPYCEIMHASACKADVAHLGVLEVEGPFFRANARVIIDEMLDQIKKTGARRLSESDVLRSVFGLGEAEAQNLRQVSNVTNISSERVRQLREKGLDTLRRKMIASGINSTGDLL